MLNVKIEDGSALFFVDPETSSGLRITFQRTLRIPDDGNNYPLPPGLGAYPIRRVLDYKDKVPASWLKTSGVFLPLYQREALWISFQPRQWRPNAVKIAAGKINAVSGEPWSEALQAQQTKPKTTALRAPTPLQEAEQDYLVVGPQPWLDGFNSGKGVIRQFVAMPLGMGYTVEGQVTGKEEHGGIQIIVYEPKEGLFPVPPPPQPAPIARDEATGSFGPAGAVMPMEMASEPMASYGGPPPMGAPSGGYGPPGAAMPPPAPSPAAAPAPAMKKSAAAPGSSPARTLSASAPMQAQAPLKAAAMGLAAGGKIEQTIERDPHGIATWDAENRGRVFVHLVNSALWTEITGEPPPPTPVSAATYTQYGYPWFALYDQDSADVSPSPVLAGVKSVAEMDAEHGFVGVDDNDTVAVKNVVKLGKPKDEVPDGEW